MNGCRGPARPCHTQVSCPGPPFRARCPESSYAVRHVQPALPQPLPAPRPGLLLPAQPHPDGFDAHRAGGPRARFPQAGGLFPRTRRRRRRVDGHRRHLAQPGRLAQALRRQAQLALGNPQAPHRHPGRARSRWPHLHADPARRPVCRASAAGVGFQGKGADQPADPARAHRLGRRTPDQGLRHHREAGPRGRLRRDRGDGLGRLSDQPVPQRPHQPAQGRLGRQPGEAHALRGRDRAPHPRSGGQGLHPYLSAVDARAGGKRLGLGRDRDAGQGHRGGRRHHHQYRHRLA